MSPLLELLRLSAALLVATLGAALVPLVLKPRPHQADSLIAFAAGVLLGAALFHLLPEAIHAAGPRVLAGTAAGALALFLVERLLRRSAPAAGAEVHAMMHGAHGHGAAGTAALVGLSVHTLCDGVALGSAIEPGLATIVFLAIFAHQLPTAFSLSALLRMEGRSVAVTLFAMVVFAAMVPFGGLLYFAARDKLGLASVLPWALAFSSGNFLHLAFGDLLPDLGHRHVKGARMALGLGLGLAAMLGLRLLVG